MLGTRLDVKPYLRQYRSALLDLSAFSQWTHKHLDWHSISQWLDQERGRVYLAWRGAELAGYIGLSPPIEDCSWIRALGIRDGHMPGRVIDELWERAEAHCRRWKIRRVAILMLTNWLPTYLRPFGFNYADDVITMRHIGCRLPAARTAPAQLRPAEPKDVSCIAAVDCLAFPALWRMTEADIWQALRICAHATVADREGRVVAYQLGTRHEGVGHLARLAVAPAQQRLGIGSLLLRRFLSDCERAPLETISVNTQMSNAPSQALYGRFGFLRNNKDYEVWHKQIA